MSEQAIYTGNILARLARLVRAYSSEVCWGTDQRSEAIKKAYNRLYHAADSAPYAVRRPALPTPARERMSQSDGI